MPEISLLPEYVTRINASWRKTTESVLETARLCADADKGLRSKDRAKLIKQLDFNAATFSKLVKIGSRQELQKDSVTSLLPPSYSIVYEVAKLNDGDLQEAIKDGVINPGMTRSELSAWMGKRKGDGSETSEEDHGKVIATVKVPADYDDDRREQLVKALAKLEAKFGCSLEHPSDPQAAAFERMFERMNDYIRKEARRYIAALKARRLRGLGRLSPAEKKKRWGFYDDEIDIPFDASWDRVKEALDVVGNADQFDRIRDEALRLFDVPETVVSSEPPENQEEAMKAMRAAADARRKRDDIKPDRAKLASFKYV